MGLHRITMSLSQCDLLSQQFFHELIQGLRLERFDHADLISVNGHRGFSDLIDDLDHRINGDSDQVIIIDNEGVKSSGSCIGDALLADEEFYQFDNSVKPISNIDGYFPITEYVWKHHVDVDKIISFLNDARFPHNVKFAIDIIDGAPICTIKITANNIIYARLSWSQFISSLGLSTKTKCEEYDDQDFLRDLVCRYEFCGVSTNLVHIFSIDNTQFCPFISFIIGFQPFLDSYPFPHIDLSSSVPPLQKPTHAHQTPQAIKYWSCSCKHCHAPNKIDISVLKDSKNRKSELICSSCDKQAIIYKKCQCGNNYFPSHNKQYNKCPFCK